MRDRRRPIVLIVDDSPDVRKAFTRILCDRGFLCVEAKNGEEGLEFILNGLKPTLILCDNDMPVMDGPKFLQYLELRDGSGRLAFPVVLCSGDDSAVTTAERWKIPFFKKGSVLTQLYAILDKYAEKPNGHRSDPPPSL